MADDLVPGSIIAQDMRLCKLPCPVLGCVSLRRAEHAEVGCVSILVSWKSGLDASGFQGAVIGEEEERSRRVRLAGFELVYVPGTARGRPTRRASSSTNPGQATPGEQIQRF